MKTLVRKARKVAGYGNVVRSHMAAIAFTKSMEVIATAHNRRVSGQNFWTEHAEVVLLHKLVRTKAFQRFGDINILVVRVLRKDNSLSMAKPCASCQKKLSRFNVQVWYTTNEGGIKQL